MKSYDDLQRFKEKTQTNHIEFKDMSEQSLHYDSSNWAIIKQLLNDGSDPVLDKSQRIDIVVPQPVDPSMLIAPPATAAPTQPSPSLTAPGFAPSVGASLFDSISSSLKPVTAPVASVPVAPQPAISPVAPAESTVQLTKKVADLRPESVAHASGSLLDQLAKSQPKPSQTQQHAPMQQSAPSQQGVLQQSSPVAQHQVVPPQFQPQPVVQQPHYPSAQISPQPLNQPQPVHRQQAAPLHQAQPSATSPLFTSRQAIQPHAQPATISSNISYKQLFSPTHGSAELIVSKDTPLQSLLEKIASCR
ncbi:cellulose biosynthesis protein BcsO [Erwiniaceae bacterium CAU 1747]